MFSTSAVQSNDEAGPLLGVLALLVASSSSIIPCGVISFKKKKKRTRIDLPAFLSYHYFYWLKLFFSKQDVFLLNFAFLVIARVECVQYGERQRTRGIVCSGHKANEWKFNVHGSYKENGIMTVEFLCP